MTQCLLLMLQPPCSKCQPRRSPHDVTIERTWNVALHAGASRGRYCQKISGARATDWQLLVDRRFYARRWINRSRRVRQVRSMMAGLASAWLCDSAQLLLAKQAAGLRPQSFQQLFSACQPSQRSGSEGQGSDRRIVVGDDQRTSRERRAVRRLWLVRPLTRGWMGLSPVLGT